LMMSRRGQIKGIDLDSFTPIYTPYDKMMDFMFLAACVVLFVFNAPSSYPRQVEWKVLASDESRLRAEFELHWPFGDIEARSAQRVKRAELCDLLVDLIRRCHQLVYAKEPRLFSMDIARLISMKRRLRAEEFVID
jgi:hypothetical protein